MKIDNHNSIIGKKIYEELKNSQEPKKEEKPETQKASRDSVNISSEARLIQETLNEVKNHEVSREEKVQELKEKIEAGEYKVDTQALAQKMLELDEE